MSGDDGGAGAQGAVTGGTTSASGGKQSSASGAGGADGGEASGGAGFEGGRGQGTSGNAGAGGTAGAGASGADVGGMGGDAGSSAVCSGSTVACSSVCADLDSDPLNCGACLHDCLGGACVAGQCQPSKLADIPDDVLQTIGLSPDFVLVGGRLSENSSISAAIYTVDKHSGAVKMTRPRRKDSRFARQLLGTKLSLVSVEDFSVSGDIAYLSRCSLNDCRDSVPPADSFVMKVVLFFGFDAVNSRVYWFDPSTTELNTTDPDNWQPRSVGPLSAESSAGTTFPKAVVYSQGRVFGGFGDTVDAIPVDGSSAPESVSGYPSGEEKVGLTGLLTTPDSLVLRFASGNLYRAPLPAGIDNRAPDRIRGLTGVARAATSGSTLFTAGSSAIVKCTLPLCSVVEPVVADAAFVVDFAVDETAIYWLSATSAANPGGSIMRLAR